MVKQDVVVLGGGPAGLGLASELAGRGVRVASIDPDPEGVWDRQYAGFLEDWSPAYRSCISARWAAPSVVTSRHHHVLDDCFALVDTGALQCLLRDRASETGVARVAGRAQAVAHHATGSTVTLASGDALEASLVVDATGAGAFLARDPHGPLAAQVGHGRLIEVPRHPFRCGEMALMDLRPLDDGERVPTFLFALPLDYHRLFVEETSLIATVPVSRRMLERRLDERLARLGLGDAEVLRTAQQHTPMTRPLPLRDQRTLGFGSAASMVHPSTGHHVARVLGRAPAVAEAIAEQLGRASSLDEASRGAWRAVWPRDDVRKWELYTFGARFLYHLDQDRTERFFDAFFSLPASDWSGYFSARHTSTQLAGVMSRVFARLDPALRWDLMRLSAGPSSPSHLLRAALAM